MDRFWRVFFVVVLRGRVAVFLGFGFVLCFGFIGGYFEFCT